MVLCTCTAELNLKWTLLKAQTDTQRITQIDLDKVNRFAEMELNRMNLLNESAASTGLPLTDKERQMKKAADVKHKEEKK